MNSTLRFLAACLISSVAVSAFAQSVQTSIKAPFNPDRYLARLKDTGLSPATLNSVENQNLQVIRRYDLVPGLVVLEELPRPATQSPGRGDKQDPKAMLDRLAALRASGLFEYVEPDYLHHAMAVPTDAAYGDGRLWGLNNFGQSGGVAGVDIQAEDAWDITTGSSSVIVAVIDSGIRSTHADLSARMWVNPGEIAGNGIDDDGDGYVDNVHGLNAITGRGNPVDDNGHGTHVAGTIGAAANNGQPHVGVAWNVTLMGCKFLDSAGSGSNSDAIDCINFAVQNGARILNNSWGGGGYSQALRDAIEAASNAGVLFIAAAGNSGLNNDQVGSYPSNYDLENMVAVAAIDRTGSLASFSNYGFNTVHLAAPGVDIYSAGFASDTSYEVFSGTSMASPHVAGVAALIWSEFPGASMAEVKQRLLAGTDASAALDGRVSTGGRLNALTALTIAPDGNLELAVSSSAGNRLLGGTQVDLYVRVTDLNPVSDATVTGTTSLGQNLFFANNGSGPDQTADDEIYSVRIDVPLDGTDELSLTVQVTAPSKNPASRTTVYSIINPPPNDQFANADVIDTLPALRVVENELATEEPNEPVHVGVGGGNSVWWRWTAPANMDVVASTAGSTFDTVLAVYIGSTPGELFEVDINDDGVGTYTSETVFRAYAGTTYHFAVDGYFGSVGEVEFRLAENPPLMNDDFADRISLSGVNLTARGSNFGATWENGEPNHFGNVLADKTVWWSWTAPSSGTYAISTSGSSFDTIMGVYIGNSVGSLFPVQKNDDAGAGILYSEIIFSATAGQTYQIAVDGLEDFDTGLTADGTILLSVTGLPANDAFSSAEPVQGEFVQTSGYNILATQQSGEPSPNASSRRRTVWWTWTAPRSGNASVTTVGSSFDTTLGIYRGSSVNSLQVVEENDDFIFGRLTFSELTFGAEAGQTYYIQVDGWYDEFNDAIYSGRIELTISLDGASRLEPPTMGGTAGINIGITGELDRPYVLYRSDDFINWVPVSTNTLIGQELIFNDPNPPADRGYYRSAPAVLIEE